MRSSPTQPSVAPGVQPPGSGSRQKPSMHTAGSKQSGHGQGRRGVLRGASRRRRGRRCRLRPRRAPCRRVPKGRSPPSRGRRRPCRQAPGSLESEQAPASGDRQREGERRESRSRERSWASGDGSSFSDGAEHAEKRTTNGGAESIATWAIESRRCHGVARACINSVRAGSQSQADPAPRGAIGYRRVCIAATSIPQDSRRGGRARDGAGLIATALGLRGDLGHFPSGAGAVGAAAARCGREERARGVPLRRPLPVGDLLLRAGLRQADDPSFPNEQYYTFSSGGDSVSSVVNACGNLGGQP
jgi:hypothetical protein